MSFPEIWGKVHTIIQMNWAEAQKLYNCVQMLPEGAVIVEIGTYQGGSAAVMAAATNGKVYTVDIAPKATTFLLENIESIVGSSEEVAKTWDKPIDLLFIDGSHFYADVRNDIQNWFPKLKDRRIVCFHDYGSHPDVTTAVNESLIQRIGYPLKDSSLLAIIK